MILCGKETAFSKKNGQLWPIPSSFVLLLNSFDKQGA